jgi:hypothetical protein
MSKMFHQWKIVASSYQEKDIAGNFFMKMGSCFTMPTVTCHLQ